MITHTPPLAGYLLIKTLVARQQPTNTVIHVHRKTCLWSSSTTLTIHLHCACTKINVVELGAIGPANSGSACSVVLSDLNNSKRTSQSLYTF